MLSNILIQLGLDQTFFPALLTIWVTLCFVSFLYFKPLVFLFESRRERLEKEQQAAEEMLRIAEKHNRDYEYLIMEERKLLRSTFDSTVKEVQKEEQQKLALARLQSLTLIRQAGDQLGIQSQSLRQEWEPQKASFIQALLTRLSGRRSA